MEKGCKTGREAVYRLLHEYAERNKEKILELLTDDIIWIGTAAHEHKFGRQEVREILEDDLKTDPTPYGCEITELKEIIINPKAASVFALTRVWQRGRENFVMECRNTYVCCETEEGFKICSWHCSMATPLQEENEYFPITFAEGIIEKATLDSLTRIKNRASFEEAIQSYLDDRNRNYAFILIDLDHFKWVNDHFGHQSGDQVLLFTAEQMKKSFGDDSIVARLGGDEFVVFIPELNSREDAEHRIEVFMENLSYPMYFQEQSYTPSASAGVVLNDKKRYMSYEQCYQAADKAMYQAKNNGKHTWYIDLDI